MVLTVGYVTVRSWIHLIGLTGLKSLIANILRHLREIRAINAVDLPDDLKKRVRKTYVELAVFKRADQSRKVAQIVGLPMHYCTESSLLYLFREIFVRQAYWFECNTETPYIVDCGSNIGLSLLFFKMMYPGAKVLAFEPDANAFACLERNMRENRIHGVEMVEKALSDTTGKIFLFHDMNDPGSLRASTIRDDIFGDRQEVDAVRLSDYLIREVDFLKIDVEGAEAAIIGDLAQTGKLPLIKQMAIEYHHHIHDGPDSLSQMLRVLEDACFGYQLESRLTRPMKSEQFQDILVYAYRREDMP